MKKIEITDFFKGIISLVISQILIKIFGVIYSLYITNKNGFGDEGNAIYMSGYQIYALLLTISSIGVPNAISKIISEKKSIKDYTNLERIFKISVFVFAVIGFFGTVTLFIFSGFIAENILQIPETKLSLMVLSPAIFFVSISSVVRGYCNGENKIYVTAKSQFFEQIIKSVLTITLVEILSRFPNSNTEILAAIANFATTLATFCSLMYILKKYRKIKKQNIYLSKYNFPKERIFTIIRKVLIISIPMTTSAILTSLGKNVDSVTVVRILKNILGEETAIIKYGILSSKVDILIALPLSFNIAISTAFFGEISRKKAINDISGIVKKIETSILITIIIGIPSTFGMCFYSEQIFDLLYPRANEGAILLSIASFSIIFSLLVQTINGILQGLGKNNVPVLASVIGLLVKIFSNIILIRVEGIYEKGAIIGNILSNIVSFIIVYIALIRNIDIKLNLLKKGIKPILASAIMIFFSLKIYNFLVLKNININICTISSIFFAILIYIFCCFFMKILKKNEIS